MEQDIPIGMSAKSFVMFELDAANFQRNSGTELVGVESVANANRKFRVLSFWSDEIGEAPVGGAVGFLDLLAEKMEGG